VEEHAFHLAIVLLMGHNRGAALAEFAERRDQQRHRPHARLCLRLSLSCYIAAVRRADLPSRLAGSGSGRGRAVTSGQVAGAQIRCLSLRRASVF
jgi:hypothetical protein